MPPKKGKDGPGPNFIFFLVSAVPPAILATFDDTPEPGEEDDQCLFILALKRANFLPLWKEVCPLEHEKKWGPDLERLRAQICCLGDETSGHRNVLALKWEADALSTLAQFGWANAWEKCLDEDNRTIPGVEHYSRPCLDIRSTLFDRQWFTVIAPQHLKIFWGWWLSKKLEAAKASQKRSQTAIDKTYTNLVAKFGANFLTGEENDDPDRNFSQRELSHSLRSLESYIGNLEWTFLTDVDIAVLSVPVPDEVTQAVLHAHWEKLSVAAKRHEQCACAIGWLAHMVARKSSTEVFEDTVENPDLRMLSS
ncbi:hypothetical protein B0H11DRAFT_1907537 [Mycena galericulata]|nr:hypothetical protein B0H11DRAFT_1907537 [Mycena galericulata]